VDDQNFIPSRGRDIISFTIASRLAHGPTQPPIQWILASLSPEIKWLGHEVDLSSPSSAKVRNVWGYTSTPPYIFMAWYLVMHRDNFVFTFTTLIRYVELFVSI
jgi:hypothetical protein